MSKYRLSRKYQSGAAAVEYALLCAFVPLICFATVQQLGFFVERSFGNMEVALNNDSPWGNMNGGGSEGSTGMGTCMQSCDTSGADANQQDGSEDLGAK